MLVTRICTGICTKNAYVIEILAKPNKTFKNENLLIFYVMLIFRISIPGKNITFDQIYVQVRWDLEYTLIIFLLQPPDGGNPN